VPELIGSPPAWHQRWGFDVQEFSAAGLRTFAVVEGRRETFPVLFVHSLPGSSFLWGPVIAALGRNRLSIAPDFPGWGRSVSRFTQSRVDLSPQFAAAWLSGVLVAQSIERFDLVACGNGCWPALELLLQDSNRIRRLSLLQANFWLLSSSLQDLVRKAIGRETVWNTARIRRWLQQEHVSDAIATSFPACLVAGQTASGFSNAVYTRRFPLYREALGMFRGAIQVIWGVDDRHFRPDLADELIAGLDRPEVHRIAQAGAYPTLEQPAETAERLREFLGE
jgi:pimeloyl-ACP methyl ester carboxylesterase